MTPRRRAHDPILGPRGESLILFDALLHPVPGPASGARTLMLGRLNWADGFPLINDGEAH